jgi:hypothetical protein
VSEHIDSTFRVLVMVITLSGLLAIAAAGVMISRGMVIDGLLIGAASLLLLRWYWRATARKRALARHGFHAGQRVGTHWEYQELHDGVVMSLVLPLDYAGRGEYDIHIPGERDWAATMPAWARERRAEIVERLGAVFKRSQMHFDADIGAARPADG